MQVLYSSRPSFMSWEMIKRLVFSLAPALVLSALVWFISGQGLIPGGLSALLILLILAVGISYPLLWRHAHLFIITDRGVRREDGFLLRTSSRELSFRRIQIIDVHQNLFERLLLRTGDIHIDTAGNSGDQDEIVFFGVKNPRQVEGILREGEDALYGRRDEETFYNPYQQDRPSPQGQAPNPAARPQGPAPWEREGSGSAPWERPDNPDPSPPYN